MEEMVAKAEEQHLDADVEVPVHKTWRIEDVVEDAADEAPEQMNSFVQGKTEVFEKIEDSPQTTLYGRRLSTKTRSWRSAHSRMS